MTGASRLAKALQALAEGLPNPADESTDYFKGFHAPLARAIKLTPSSVKQALAIGPRYEVDLGSADDLFANAEDAANWGDELAHGFQQLHAVMKATLGEVSVAHARGAGVVRVRMWVFGRTDDGTLVGLRSTSTET
ncbi:MAG TPA: nuclease A inhibitor family protein [Kofleriaceae bacterium]